MKIMDAMKYIDIIVGSRVMERIIKRMSVLNFIGSIERGRR